MLTLPIEQRKRYRIAYGKLKGVISTKKPMKDIYSNVFEPFYAEKYKHDFDKNK